MTKTADFLKKSAEKSKKVQKNARFYIVGITNYGARGHKFYAF